MPIFSEYDESAIQFGADGLSAIYGFFSSMFSAGLLGAFILVFIFSFVVVIGVVIANIIAKLGTR